MSSQSSIPSRPKLLVGASAEDRHITDILRSGLDGFADVTSWCAGGSAPPSNAREFDFAVVVLRSKPRGSMLLGLGVVLGALGRERTLIVCPASGALDLPSDLRGVTRATYPPANDSNVHIALGGVCSTIKEQVRRLVLPAAPIATSQVARRRRRSVGTACSVRPGQTLRIADISVTGALLETYGEIPENQVLDLELTLENGSRIQVTAKVVRIQYPQWGRVGGVGVVFTRFAGESRALLERYIDADPSGFSTTSAVIASPPRSPSRPA
jgi:hypothetical protein